MDIRRHILFEDNYLLVIDKPAGMSVEGRESVQQAAMDYLRQRWPKKNRLRAQPVHRIDRLVSGVLLLAKTPLAIQSLHGQFARRKVSKTYLALVAKPMAAAEGTLEHWLAKDDKHRRAVLSSSSDPSAKRCVLRFRMLASEGEFHLVEIKPLSGRYHQIRAQLAAEGNPIVGDTKYGYAGVGIGYTAICLHAYRLVFEHPKTGARMEMEAPLPRGGPWEAFRQLPRFLP
ncbi:MAG: RNA pseudouridine synthase [Saprospiraceae bacterium]|nr:MAG: RNA pseudouridine synthase [Saprospiraceae bacterium]